MVSDEQIVKRIGEILATADLTTTTTSAIRKQLEQELDIDLSGRKAFVREHVDNYLNSHPPSQPEDEEAQQGEDVEADAEEEAAEKENEELEEAEDEDEEEEEEEKKPEQDSKRFQAKIDRVKRESLQKEKKKRAATGGGYTKLCRLSPELAAVMGEKEMARTQVVKSLWVYIRAHNLQDPGNKRRILCDDHLEAVFGTKTTDMFKMNKYLTKHLWPLDSPGDEEEVRTKRPKLDSEDEGKSKSKKPKSEKREAPDKETKKGKGGFTAPLQISETLREFFDTGESELSRSEVVKRMWEYIKENNLQNPSDKRQILCDNKLKKVFGCDSFVGFSMMKHLSPHFPKIENAE